MTTSGEKEPRLLDEVIGELDDNLNLLFWNMEEIREELDPKEREELLRTLRRWWGATAMSAGCLLYGERWVIPIDWTVDEALRLEIPDPDEFR